MSLFTNKKVLVLGAHCDDEVLGVGGTILKAKEDGAKVDVLILTDSSSSQYLNDLEKQENRDTCFYECCNILNVDNAYKWNLPDMKLDTLSHIEINKKLEEFLCEKKYDIVFVHHPNDINKDHQIVFESLMVVARPVPNQSIKKIFTYYTPSSTEWGGYNSSTHFLPNCYIDITKFLEKKKLALLKYKDELREFPHPRSIENIEYMAKFFGSQVGLFAAEPFNLIRTIER